MNHVRKPLRDGVAIVLFAVFASGLFIVGCQQAPEGGGAVVEPLKIENPESIAACLPAGITMDTKTTDKEGDTSETVKDTLARLKVQIKNGKLYDMNKREIHFYTPTGKGLDILREKGYKDLLKHKYTVVMIAASA